MTLFMLRRVRNCRRYYYYYYYTDIKWFYSLSNTMYVDWADNNNNKATLTFCGVDRSWGRRLGSGRRCCHCSCYKINNYSNNNHIDTLGHRSRKRNRGESGLIQKICKILKGEKARRSQEIWKAGVKYIWRWQHNTKVVCWNGPLSTRRHRRSWSSHYFPNAYFPYPFFQWRRKSGQLITFL